MTPRLLSEPLDVWQCHIPRGQDHRREKFGAGENGKFGLYILSVKWVLDNCVRISMRQVPVVYGAQV